MPIVYELRENTEFIEHVQRAKLTTEEFGIEPSHGLFGSAGWWQKTASGELRESDLYREKTAANVSRIQQLPGSR